MLRVEGLWAGYGDAVVLEDVSVTLAEGERLAVLGRNGVGKTTFMLALMGFARTFRGSATYCGVDLVRAPRHRRAALGLGWVPQERDVFPSLTVEENLLASARPGQFDLRRVYQLLPRLEARRRNWGDQLSGGEQQMLAIGRALMLNPSLLLLDEPFEGLAPTIVDQLEDLIETLTHDEGLGCVLIEQHARDALKLCDAGIVLERGRVVEAGRAADLLADFSRVERYLKV